MYKSYIELIRDVEKNGEIVSPSNVSVNRSFQTKELNNVQLFIDDFQHYLISDEEVAFFTKELDWYFNRFEVSKKPPLELTHDKYQINEQKNIEYDSHLKQLHKMAEDLGIKNRCGPNSNYGEMMLRLKNHVGITQLDWVVEKLKKDKGTRQAIAFYNNPIYQYYSNPDFVCCLTQMFSIKDNRLNTVINSRSNDLINCFRYDSIWWNIFQQIVLRELTPIYKDLKLGYMLINIFSAHFYTKDNSKLIQILDENFKFKTLNYII